MADARFIFGVKAGGGGGAPAKRAPKKRAHEDTGGPPGSKLSRELRDLMRDHENHGMDALLRADVAKAMAHGDRYKALALQGMRHGGHTHPSGGRWARYSNVTLTGVPFPVSFWAPRGHIGAPLSWQAPPSRRGCSVLYSPAEYDTGVVPPHPLWGRDDTDTLFAAADRYGMRWCVVRDRWKDATTTFTSKDMMARYYAVAAAVVRHRLTGPDGHALWLQHPLSSITLPLVIVVKEDDAWAARAAAWRGRSSLKNTKGGEKATLHPAVAELRAAKAELDIMLGRQEKGGTANATAIPQASAARLSWTKPAVYGRGQDMIFPTPQRHFSALQKEADTLLANALEGSMTVASVATMEAVGEVRAAVMANLAAHRGLTRVLVLQKAAGKMANRLDALEKEYGGA